MNRHFAIAILPALFFQLIGALLYFVLFPNGIIAQGIYSATKLLLIGWPLIWIRHIKTPFILRPTKQAILYGTLSGTIGAGAILALFFAFTPYFIQFSPQLTEKIIALNLTSPVFFIIFALFLSLFHSLLEEYYWRWFVFAGLERPLSPIAAGLIASIAFASHHYVILSQFFPPLLTLFFGTMVGAGGAWWCYVYKKTGTLFGAWISHAMIDAAIMLIGYMLIFQ